VKDAMDSTIDWIRDNHEEDFAPKCNYNVVVIQRVNTSFWKKKREEKCSSVKDAMDSTIDWIRDNYEECLCL
jgi:hypothetical protein